MKSDRVATWIVWLAPFVAALLTILWRRQHDDLYPTAGPSSDDEA